MKLREQAEQSRELAERFHQAVTAMVRSQVKWLEPAFVASVAGMPRKKVQLGLVAGGVGSWPLVIVHLVDESVVRVARAEQVAEWPYQTVDALPGLAEFLREQVNIEGLDVQPAGDAWARREAGEAVR